MDIANTTTQPVYTVGSRLRLPFGAQNEEHRFEVTKIEARESGVWYQFNLLQTPFAAHKWFNQIQLTPANPIVFAEPLFTAKPQPEPITPLEIKGRELVIHGIANKAGHGATLDETQELAAKAAGLIYELAILTTGDLQHIILKAAWLLERTAYSETKQSAYDNWADAMWELGAAQLTANVLADQYLKARKLREAA